MNFSHLDYIVAIMEERSISRAAERLFTTQPAVSQYLARLEAELGTPLFIRSHSELKPTPAGSVFVEQAQKILAIERQTETMLDDIRNLRKGLIRLGISKTVAAVILPKVLPAFYEKYPGIQVEIGQSDEWTLDAAVLQGYVDVSIFPLLKHMKLCLELVYRPLCQDELLLVVPKSHPLSHLGNSTNGQKPIVDLRLFKDDWFCLRSKGGMVRESSDRALRDYQIRPRIRMEARQIFAVYNTAVSTGSLTFIPELLSRYPGLRQDAVLMSINPDKYWTRIVAAFRKDTYLNQATLDLIDLMRNLFVLGTGDLQ